jgi:hypothetical protein
MFVTLSMYKFIFIEQKQILNITLFIIFACYFFNVQFTKKISTHNEWLITSARWSNGDTFLKNRNVFLRLLFQMLKCLFCRLFNTKYSINLQAIVYCVHQNTKWSGCYFFNVQFTKKISTHNEWLITSARWSNGDTFI